MNFRLWFPLTALFKVAHVWRSLIAFSPSLLSLKEFLILPFPLSEAADCVTSVTSFFCFSPRSSSCSICSCCGEEDTADDGCVYTGRTFPQLHSVKPSQLQSSRKSYPHLPPLWRSRSLITCTHVLVRKACVQMLTCFNWFAHIYF